MSKMQQEAMRSKIFKAKVMHKRLTPVQHMFSYQVYYLGIVLSELYTKVSTILKINTWGRMSFYEKDHNSIDNSTKAWIDAQLIQHGLKPKEHEVMLVSMPHIMGYVFNPVSFWLCITPTGMLSMVVCEVCNTFKEKHNYICLPPKGQTHIPPHAWLKAQKVFHVSPFLECSGEYEFMFNLEAEKLQIYINMYNQKQEKVLITSLIGDLHPMSKKALSKIFWLYPLVTFKTIALIYIQAIRLKLKKVKYRNKPKQQHPTISHTH